jgi:Mg-chelatase subunit ChlD
MVGSMKFSTESRHTIALILIAILIPSITPIQLPSTTLIAQRQTSTPSNDIYLVNNATTKVLRVPYLHQDGVGHCWLYALGMIIAYYTGSFNPDIILNKMGKGFDVGLNPFLELEKLRRVVKELYGIEFSSIKNVNKSESTELIKIIKNEITNGRPIYLFGSVWVWKPLYIVNHVIVITGFHENITGFYIVVNDPSGYFTNDVWKATARIDGSTLGIDSRGFYEYGVLVSIDRVVKTLWYSGILTIVNAPNPKPPEATVHAYTWQPSASYYLYDSEWKRLQLNSTRFYHNNYLNKSLWYPIPIVSSKESYVDFYIFIYPNILQQREFILEVNVTKINLNGKVVSYLDKLNVLVYNYSYAQISSDGLTPFSYIPYMKNSILFSLNPHGASTIQVSFKLTAKNATRDLICKWGPVEIYVYHDVALLVIKRPGIKLIFVGGVIYEQEKGLQIVDLYVSSTVDSILFGIIKKAYFAMIKPCKYVFIDTIPSSEKGGYYYVCRLMLPMNQSSIEISGRISWIWNQCYEINKVLNLPSTGFRKEGEVYLYEAVFDRGLANLKMYYSVFQPTGKSHLIKINVNNSQYTLNVGSQSSGNVSYSIIDPGFDWTSVRVVLQDSSGREIDSLNATILSPFIVSLSDLQLPSGVLGDSYVTIRYNLSIPQRALMNAGLKVFDITPSAALYLNNSHVNSTTWVDDVFLQDTSLVFSMKTATRVPSCGGAGDECVYEFTLVPKLGFRYRGEDIVYVYSPQVNKSAMVRVYKSSETIERVAVVLVIDKSGSMDDRFQGMTKLSWAKKAAIKLVNLTFDGDYLGLITFSDFPKLTQDIVIVNSTTRDIIVNKIHSITAKGSTNIGDSLKLAVDMLNKPEFKGLKRAIILLTDGKHNTGTHPINVLDYIKSSGVLVYTIGLGDPNVGEGIDEDLLQKIARETGGRYYHAPTPDKLAEIFDNIRGVVSRVNLIDSSIITLQAGKSAWMIYPLDPSRDFIAEISWDTGSEPLVVLNVMDITVDQYNASSLGIEVSYPASNTLRIRIPSGGNISVPIIGQAFTLIPVNMTIINRGNDQARIETKVFGGREQLLELMLDNPVARYAKGQYLYYRVSAEVNKKVLVTFTDSRGSILYSNVHTVESTGPFSGLATGYLKLPDTPGTYYLKASLIDVYQLKSQIIPIQVVDTPYSDPLTVNITRRVEGYGLLKLPLSIFIKDQSLMGSLLIIQTRLEPRNPYAPIVSIQSDLLTINSSRVNNYLVVNIPPYAQPGYYNISLILYVIGRSVIAIDNAVEIHVPELKVNVIGFTDTVIGFKGDQITQSLLASVSGEISTPIDLEIKPVFLDDKTLINGSTVYYSKVTPNTTLNLVLSYDTARIGVFPGYLKLLFNNTPVKSLLQVLVVLPRETDTNKTIWGYGYNEVTIGPDPDKDIKAQLRLSWKGVVSGIIATPLNPKSQLDYLAYAYSSEPGAKGILTIIIPNEYRRQGYFLRVERESVLISNIDLSSQSSLLQLELEPGFVYRLWVEYSGETNTTTTTISWTTITKPLIIGGGGREPITTSLVQLVETSPTRLYNLLAIIIIILAFELATIYVLYRKKK